MQLDIETLSVVTVFVTALLGALLVFAGLQNRAVRAPMVWGAAYIVSAVGLALLTTRGSAPEWVAVNLANALVLLGSGLIWAGARMFGGRPVRPAWSRRRAGALARSPARCRLSPPISICAWCWPRPCWRCWPRPAPTNSGAAAPSR